MEAEIRQVFFFDTPELDLYGHGVVVRARRARSRGDTVVKLRPVVPRELPAALRAARDFGVEVDAMPGGFICSGSLKGSADPHAVKQAAAGERPLRKLFAKAQRTLYREHAPEGIELDDLRVLGPVLTLRLKFTPPPLGRRVTAEIWLYPDDSRPRAVDEVPARGGVPGGRREPRVPQHPWDRPGGRAGGEDPARAGVLQLAYSSSRSATMIRAAASSSARWENACGKLPRWRPVAVSNSSA